MHLSRMRTACLLPGSPSMHCSGGVYLLGVYLPGECTCLGVCVPSQGGVPARGVYLPRGMYLPGGVPANGGVSARGGVPAQGMYLPGGSTWSTSPRQV